MKTFFTLNFKLLTCILALTINHSALTIAQNLVPNGDFELGPNQSAEGWGISIAGPDSWIAVNGTTPDRIYYGDPLASRDNDTAQSGMAYVEFYGKDTLQSLEAEVGRATLISPLQAGKKYKIRFHLDIDDYFYNGPAGISFRFNGGDSISSVLQPNTGNWESYNISFIATAASTEIKLIATGGPSLVKIDSISLEIDTTVGICEYLNNKDNFIVYPNPFSDILYITKPYSNDLKNISSITLYDIYGNKNSLNFELKSYGIIVRRGNLSSGYYLMRICSNNNEITKKILIN